MFVVLKTSEQKLNEYETLFEAARGHWRVDILRASKCSHAIVTMKGCKDIKAVYKIDKWYKSTRVKGRSVFAGETDKQLENILVGKKLNKNLIARSAQYPVRYVSENELLAV